MMPLNRKFEITDARGGSTFSVRVVSRADESEISGLQDDGTLKVRLKAPSAGDDAANEELIGLLAAQLDLTPTQLEIVAGQTGREKLISVTGLSTADLEARLAQLGPG